MDAQLSAAAALVGLLGTTPLCDVPRRAGLWRFGALFAVFYLVFKIYRFFVYPRFFSPLRHLPGPTDHHLFIGQVLNQFASGSPNEPYVSWMKRWPREPFIRFFTFGNTETLLCTNLEAHRELHVPKVYAFEKPDWHARMIVPIVGEGIVFAKGEVHKAQRRILQPLFSIANVKTLVPLFQAAGQRLCDKFDRAIHESDGVIEVAQEYSAFTLEIMGTFALGIDMAGPLAAEISRCYRAVFDQPTLGQILIGINAYVPVRWLPLKTNDRFLAANATIRRLLTDVIRERVREVEARGLKTRGGIAEGRDMLTFMVEEKCVVEEGQEKWDEGLILNQMLNFVAAGHETTAALLTWATYRMTIEPKHQARLRAEVKELLRRSPVPTFSDLQSLHHLGNFANECLRYYCPAIIVPREAQHDVNVCGVFIPKGTNVLVFPAALHFNPGIWGPAADAFDPDRWDDLPAAVAADPGALNAFVQGPRMCPGRVLAVVEFKSIIVDLLSRFEVEALPGSGPGDPPPKLVNPSPLLKPHRGLRVRVRRLPDDA